MFLFAGLVAAISLGLLFGLVIGSVSLGALYVHRHRHISAFLANVNVLRYVCCMLWAVRLSVCLSVVCLSVTLVHPTQAVELFGNFFSPYDSPRTLLFWCQKSLVGDAPFLLKFAFKVAGDVPVYLKLAFKVTHPFRKRRFPKFSFCCASTII